jgi:hypothetical protein
MNNSTLWNAMNHEHALLSDKESIMLTLVAKRMRNRFGKSIWTHARAVLFITSGNAKGYVLEAQSDQPLTERETGILKGYATACAEDLKPFLQNKKGD